MKAITIWQPWASLIAVGAKTIETRGWATSYRGPIAIHAAKRYTTDEAATVASEPFASALVAAGFWQEGRNEITPNRQGGHTGRMVVEHNLPLGCIVAVANLAACEPTQTYKSAEVRGGLPEHEFEFGDYAPGRYGWLLTDVQALPEPIPAKGAQGLWRWTPPPPGGICDAGKGGGMNCFICLTSITGGVDTFGPHDAPCCMSCWYAMLDFHVAEDVAATYANMSGLARMWAYAAAEGTPVEVAA